MDGIGRIILGHLYTAAPLLFRNSLPHRTTKAPYCVIQQRLAERFHVLQSEVKILDDEYLAAFQSAAISGGYKTKQQSTAGTVQARSIIVVKWLTCAQCFAGPSAAAPSQCRFFVRSAGPDREAVARVGGWMKVLFK